LARLADVNSQGRKGFITQHGIRAFEVRHWA
jgi:hypothetical protein